jgi:hypothetical protein
MINNSAFLYPSHDIAIFPFLSFLFALLYFIYKFFHLLLTVPLNSLLILLLRLGLTVHDVALQDVAVQEIALFTYMVELVTVFLGLSRQRTLVIPADKYTPALGLGLIWGVAWVSREGLGVELG